jgi:hypothetical protein
MSDELKGLRKGYLVSGGVDRPVLNDRETEINYALDGRHTVTEAWPLREVRRDREKQSCR